jgi:hypothetical protein
MFTACFENKTDYKKRHFETETVFFYKIHELMLVTIKSLFIKHLHMNHIHISISVYRSVQRFYDDTRRIKEPSRRLF